MAAQVMAEIELRPWVTESLRELMQMSVMDEYRVTSAVDTTLG